MSLADRDALESLFQSTGGDSWNQNDNWCTGAALSDWFGVKVNSGGRVEALDLDDNALQGIQRLAGMYCSLGIGLVLLDDSRARSASLDQAMQAFTEFAFGVQKKDVFPMFHALCHPAYRVLVCV